MFYIYQNLTESQQEAAGVIRPKQTWGKFQNYPQLPVNAEFYVTFS